VIVEERKVSNGGSGFQGMGREKFLAEKSYEIKQHLVGEV